MSDKRTVTVNGVEFLLPKAWGNDEYKALMQEFREARDEFVAVELENGYAHVFVNAATQVAFTSTKGVGRVPTPVR